jgi:hypothetical protein
MPEVLQDIEDEFATFTRVAPAKPAAKPREIEQELFNKNWAKEAIDNFEDRVGIPRAPEPEVKPNIQFKHRTFQMEYTKDQELFNELLNSPKYKILSMKETWTMSGDYRMFIIYSDNLDYKAESK